MRKQKRQAQAIRPFQLLEFVLGFATVFAFTRLSQPGQVNLWGLALLLVLPLVSVTRYLVLYRTLDEYERTLMLRAAALGFPAVMVGVFILSLLGAASIFGDPHEAETVPSLAVLGLLVLGWLALGLSYGVIRRREARQ